MAEPNQSGGQQAGLVRRTGRFGDDKDPNMGADTQFKPGESGNPDGRPKGRQSLSTTIQEMLDDPKFIEKLNSTIQEKVKQADPDFQGTPMKAIITTAIIEAIDPKLPAGDRHKARDWIGKFGYGTKIDVTSGGERIQQAPTVVVSPIAARGLDDAPTEAETS